MRLPSSSVYFFFFFFFFFFFCLIAKKLRSSSTSRICIGFANASSSSSAAAAAAAAAASTSTETSSSSPLVLSATSENSNYNDDHNILTNYHPLPTDAAKENDTTTTTTSTTHEGTSLSMYNQQATNWVRKEPRCLSDFTGRPVVFDMLANILLRHRPRYYHVDENENPSSSILPTTTTTTRTNKMVLLDVGCGEGYCARKAILELGADKVIGFDISHEMIARAKEASLGDSRFHYFVSPVGKLLSSLKEKDHRLLWNDWEMEASSSSSPPEQQAFDIAIAVFVFNYLTISDMEDAIEQIYQALKPGGTFIFSVPHPSMIFAHNNSNNSAFHLDADGKGYYSSRDQQILGQISTIDGVKLNIMSIHKTLGDYIHAIHKAGFQIQDVREAGVTDEHMALHPEFFESVKDRPLHLIFQLVRKN